jgi:hypothetical protein
MSDIERLECVYYSGPVPADSAVLTTLCLVFDKIYFPGVYLPKGDYDKNLLNQEIARLEALNDKDHGTAKLIGILKFLDYRLPLDGLLEYPTARDDIFMGKNDDKDQQFRKMAEFIYDTHFPPRANFEPFFDSASVKGLPESEEEISFAGNFFYQARAIDYAATHQLPLLDDGSGLALPFRAQYKDNAKPLSTLLAIESVNLIMPDLPLMTCQELVDFRLENTSELRNFRSSMLRYSRALNAEINGETGIEELVKKVKFFVETEIVPALHDLSRDLLNPNRPWPRRMADGGRICASLLTGVLTGGLFGAKSAAESVQSAILSELESKGDKQEALKRNGLYYLLKANMKR